MKRLLGAAHDDSILFGMRTVDFNDLMLADAFFQANILKGYRFLDTAGQMMNDFEERFQRMEFGPQGLSFSEPIDPSDHLQQVRVTAKQLWVHYGQGTAWTELRQEVHNLVERIATIMAIRSYTRQGFRTSLLYPVSDIEPLVNRLAHSAYNSNVVAWNELGEPLTVMIQARVRIGNLKASVIVRPVRPMTSPPTGRLTDERDLVVASAEPGRLPEHALLLDTDIYDDRRTATLEAKPLINHAVELLREKFVPFLARIAEEGGV